MNYSCTIFVSGHVLFGGGADDQADAMPFSPRRNKDLIEEMLFSANRHLFTQLDLVFFDTTSIYFEGRGDRPWDKEDTAKIIVRI